MLMLSDIWVIVFGIIIVVGNYLIFIPIFVLVIEVVRSMRRWDEKLLNSRNDDSGKHTRT